MKKILYLLMQAMIVVLSLIIISYIVFPVHIKEGVSSYPTYTPGDICINSVVYGKIERWDRVGIKKYGEILGKRIIGLPGETIEYKNGIVYINDNPIEDRYATSVGFSSKRVTLGKDEYFVMGDNRDVSIDSRSFGPVKKSEISYKELINEDKTPIIVGNTRENDPFLLSLLSRWYLFKWIVSFLL